MDFVDIRQSQKWSQYLQEYGWQEYQLTNRAFLRIMYVGKFGIAKLQRPFSLDEKLLMEVDGLCRENNVVLLNLFPNVEQDLDLLKSFGYFKNRSVDIPPKTMLIDLTMPLSKLRQKLSRSCRYSINRSNREGDHVEIIRGPAKDDIATFFNVVKNRGVEKGFYNQPLQDSLKKAQIFKEEAYIANVYNFGGDLLGTKMFLGYESNIWYAHGGTSAIGQKSKGGYRLLWDSIEYFKELGYKIMDLEGLADARFKRQTKRWKGYSAFKHKFNGTVVTFPFPHAKLFMPSKFI